MTLHLKAYKCLFINFLNEPKSYKEFFNDSDKFCVIYGVNQKEAVRDTCINDELYSYYELKKNIRTKRFKEADLYSQNHSPLLKIISMSQKEHLLHSLGVNELDIYKGAFCRNYSMYYEPNEDCNYLVKKGLMSMHEKMGSFVYLVTEPGKEAIKTTLLINKPQQHDSSRKKG